VYACVFKTEFTYPIQGLQREDLVVKFGSLTQQSFSSSSLTPLMDIVAAYENVSVHTPISSAPHSFHSALDTAESAPFRTNGLFESYAEGMGRSRASWVHVPLFQSGYQLIVPAGAISSRIRLHNAIYIGPRGERYVCISIAINDLHYEG
jgi:hypothetical protein